MRRVEWLAGPGAIVATALVAALLVPGGAWAVEFRAEQHVLVAADEVVPDDLYATGETVTVEGRVEGDLIASGREVRLLGEVGGDLMAAGQAVLVEGSVGDDLRMAGMALRLGERASVGDDIVSAGMSLETQTGSRTAGSVIFSGMQALLAGDIEGSLLGAMTALELRGGIRGDSEIEISGGPEMRSYLQYIPSPVALPMVARGLTIADTARLQGDLEYTSASEARGRGTGEGALTRLEPALDEAALRRKSIWPDRLFRLAGVIVLGVLLAWWKPAWLEQLSDGIRDRPLARAGVGALTILALPVALALAVGLLVLLAIALGVMKLAGLAALVAVLGLVGLALVGALFWLTASYLAPILVGLCTGRWMMERFSPGAGVRLILPLVAGLVLLAALGLLPYLGALVVVVVLLLGLGAVVHWLWRRGGSRPAVSPGV